MTKKLTGKTALVTAAGQGIGRAIAERLIEDGAYVIATDIDAGALSGLGCETAKLDVTDLASIQSVFEELNTLDVLCNCAGYVHSGTILETDEPSWDRSFDLNVTSMFRMTKTALPLMLKNGGGSIINIGSVVSTMKAAPNRFAYATTKSAIIGFTKAVAIDFISKGVRANVICPGTVDSPSLHDRLRDTGDYEAALAGFIERQPMGRIGRPEEIAAIAGFLASDEAAYVTGSCYTADGGMAL